MDIAQNIRNLRAERGVTQDALAEALGVSGQAVSKWETGASLPDILLLPRLAGFFGVSVDALLGVDDLRCKALCSEAEALLDARQYAEAVQLLRKACAQFPSSEWLRYRLGWAIRGTRNEAGYEESICINQKLAESAKDNTIRIKATRDLVHQYYTVRDFARMESYAMQLPPFDCCREYTIGQSNLYETGQPLVDVLKRNIDLFGNAILECLDYFLVEHERMFTQEQAAPLTREVAKEKAELMRRVMVGEKSPPPWA
ncbi:MAG: helix-turn-helix transcriptional regulator [Oscillospiraceae bacterium]|jgi:transcriptional regulator with XRE-family HTH domain|nr:helix-turn-helix transcriptional regulator [Oscillospiraceae bacterium]